MTFQPDPFDPTVALVATDAALIASFLEVGRIEHGGNFVLHLRSTDEEKTSILLPIDLAAHLHADLLAVARATGSRAEFVAISDRRLHVHRRPGGLWAATTPLDIPVTPEPPLE